MTAGQLPRWVDLGLIGEQRLASSFIARDLDFAGNLVEIDRGAADGGHLAGHAHGLSATRPLDTHERGLLGGFHGEHFQIAEERLFEVFELAEEALHDGAHRLHHLLPVA